MALLGYGERIRQAILDRAASLGRRYTNVEFASDVGTAEQGRAKPYTSAAVGEWLAERSEPSISTFRAMAKVTGKDVAWLMALDAPEPVRPEQRPAKPVDPSIVKPVPRSKKDVADRREAK